MLSELLTDNITDIYEGPSKELYEENPEECASIVIKRQKKLASAFREHMAEDLAYHIPNSNRKTFYDQVETLANEVNFLLFPVFMRMTVFSSL